MKYIYLVNRFHLKEQCGSTVRKLKQASEALGRDYEICVCESPEEAAAAVESFREREVILTAVGGDGSINQLLNQMAGTRNVLSFVPIGTGNDFCRGCGELLPDGIREVDIIRINDRYFINAACFGIDADIANDERFIHNRLIPKPLRFHAGVAAHFLAWKNGRRLTVSCDGRTFRQDFITVVAANSRYYGGGYRISPDSRIDDGLMEVIWADPLGKIKMARTILSMKNAGHLQNPAVHLLRTGRLTITSDRPVRANIDGEPLLSDRFELEVLPRACRLEFSRAFMERMREI